MLNTIKSRRRNAACCRSARIPFQNAINRYKGAKAGVRNLSPVVSCYLTKKIPSRFVIICKLACPHQLQSSFTNILFSLKHDGEDDDEKKVFSH